MPQAEQGGLAGTSSPPSPLRWLRAWNRLVFSECGRRKGSTILSPTICSAVPHRRVHILRSARGRLPIYGERERAWVPSPGGLGQVTGFGPWNLSCQLKLEETPFLPLCHKDAMIQTRAGPRPMNGLSEKSHKQMKREQDVNLLL